MGTEISPFRIDIPREQLDDLHRRLDATRWPDADPGAGWRQGIPLGYTRELAHYWRTGYDWREQEARLNAFPQFRTEIDGHTVHFIHLRSAEPDALPLVLTHGWPGSIVEFLELIGPLTDPVAHGGAAEDAFHVVVPTVPGFGMSGPAVGWSTTRVARAWAELMRRLGYDRYAAHGEDTGAAITRHLAVLDADHLVAMHLTMIASATVTAETADPDNPASNVPSNWLTAPDTNWAPTRCCRRRARKPCPTRSPILRWANWRGSSNDSRIGPTRPTHPRTPSTATRC